MRGHNVSIKSITKSTVYTGARHLGLNAILRRDVKRRLLVLCYHGVITEDHVDRPENVLRTRNTVSLHAFREQLSTLRRFFTPVSAADLLGFIAGDTQLPDYPALVTFDDGFRNNLTCAAPELERQGVPAIIHVSTGLIGQNRLLWTQELDERILGWQLQTVPMPDSKHNAKMPSEINARIEVARGIATTCKKIQDSAREKYLNLLRNEPFPRGEDWHRELYDFLSWDEVRLLHKKGFTIGSHTVAHPILTRLTEEQLDIELCESKSAIERELGQECPWIAYPNGGSDDFSSNVLSAVQRAGYRIGFTVMGGRNPRCPQALTIDRKYVEGQFSTNAFHALISGLAPLGKFFRC